MTLVLCSSSCRNCCSFPPTPPLAPPSPAPPLVWTPCHEDVAIVLCSFCACCCTNLCHSTLSALIFEFFALTLEYVSGAHLLCPYTGMTGLKRSVLTRANLLLVSFCPSENPFEVTYIISVFFLCWAFLLEDLKMYDHTVMMSSPAWKPPMYWRCSISRIIKSKWAELKYIRLIAGSTSSIKVQRLMHVSCWGIALHTHYNVLYCAKRRQK